MNDAGHPHGHAHATRPSTRSRKGSAGLVRVSTVLSGAFGTAAGIPPHVLHHVGPIAGAALVTGAQGSVLFGALGFLLTVPLLLRLKRRFGSWLAPGLALAFFAIMFTVATLWIGPWVRGEGSVGPEPPDPHHPDAAVQQAVGRDVEAGGSSHPDERGPG